MKTSAIARGIFTAVVLAGLASAQETDFGAGKRASPLQEAGGTARAMAMGSAVVGVADGSASLLWNPAGLGRMGCKEIGLHSNEGLANAVQEIAVFGTPLGEVRDGCRGGSWGGIAASLGYTDYGTFNGTDANGTATGSYGATGDLNGSVGWGKEIVPGVLSGGVTLKGDRSTFANQSYSTFAADFGVLWTALPNVDLGLVYSNLSLGSNVGGAPLTAGWRLGAGWTVSKHWLLAASSELQDKALNRLQFGTEYLVGNVDNKANVLALRAGYVVNYPDSQLAGLTGMTLGLGYTLTKAVAIDYAMVPAGELGTSQRLSLTFKFDCPKKKEAAPAPISAAAAPVVIRSVELADEHFDFDRSELKPSGMAALKENVALLKDNPQARVRVAGYTSASGTPEYNQKLSERRALSVKNFLVQQGIAPSRIGTIGYGESRPAEYEATPGRINTTAAKSNMRALFEITVE